jgi:hypothetical protein
VSRLHASLFPLLLVAAALGCDEHPTAPMAAVGSNLPALNLSQASAGGRQSFGFNGTASGFPKGEVFLTGGGAYDPATATNVVPTDTTFAHSGGGFRCTDGVAQGPLSGCATGEGVRWDTAQLLASTSFKCSLADPLKPAATSDTTVVLLADFYRAGNGNNESFTAQIIVSKGDLADNIPGVQNLWIQGVGCATAVTNFN